MHSPGHPTYHLRRYAHVQLAFFGGDCLLSTIGPHSCLHTSCDRCLTPSKPGADFRRIFASRSGKHGSASLGIVWSVVGGFDGASLGLERTRGERRPDDAHAHTGPNNDRDLASAGTSLNSSQAAIDHATARHYPTVVLIGRLSASTTSLALTAFFFDCKQVSGLPTPLRCLPS